MIYGDREVGQEVFVCIPVNFKIDRNDDSQIQIEAIWLRPRYKSSYKLGGYRMNCCQFISENRFKFFFQGALITPNLQRAMKTQLSTDL